jgi:hypothetical protein
MGNTTPKEFFNFVLTGYPYRRGKNLGAKICEKNSRKKSFKGTKIDFSIKSRDIICEFQT